jgi:hypothetical protein
MQNRRALAGPAAIGALAGSLGLPAALSVDAGLAAAIFLLCDVFMPRDSQLTWRQA